LAVGASALPLSQREAAFAQKDDKAKKAKVSGTIEFKGDAKFEADTVARVTLQDVSLEDAPAKKIGEQVIKDLKKFPINFEVEYDPAVIEKGHTYAVQVRIETKDRLDYINDTRIEVISGGKSSKDVKVPVIRVKK
jgi:putative lipoprotein